MEIKRDDAWKQRVMSYVIDAGCKGDSDVRIIRDNVVRAVRKNTCATCFGPIKPRTFIRSETATLDGRIKTIRHCQTCCDAMAKWWTTATPMEKRYELGQKRAMA